MKKCIKEIDTVIHEFLLETTGKRDCPRKYEKQLTLEDFVLSTSHVGNRRIGVRPVLTRRWGKRIAMFSYGVISCK